MRPSKRRLLVSQKVIKWTKEGAILTGGLSDYSDRTNQGSDILQHSQNRPTGDRWLKL